MSFFNVIEKLYFRQAGNLALYDKLTGLYNYNWLDLQCDRIYKDKNNFVSVIDLNDFKKINDKYGHIYGNELLVLIATRLLRFKSIDNYAEVVRFGGDEFVIISKKNPDKFLSSFSTEIYSVSYGTVEKNKNEEVFHAINRADILMYKYKHAHKLQGVDNINDSSNKR